MWKTVLAFVACVAPAFAQCPDQVIVRQPDDIRAGKRMGCGAITIAQDGIKLETRGCPSYVLITPAYDRTESRPGSGTYTEPSGRVDVTLLRFTCGTDWFLILPLGSSCKLVGERVVTQLVTYAQHPCDPIGIAEGAR